jgi:hypothetical protein
MVKNLGGNKSKKQARKGVVLTVPTQNIRYVAETGELYAVITTIYGGKTCQVMCDDGVSRRCTIRRKFTMHRHGENIIASGTWLMVGLYDWEKKLDGSQTCDILEVYSARERDQIKQTVNAKVLKHIMLVNNEIDGNKNGNEFLFSDTLVEASIDADDDESSEDNDEDKVEIISLKELYKTKIEPVSDKNQLDWLNIKEDDI